MPMRLITERDVIREIAERWKRQYFKQGSWFQWGVPGMEFAPTETTYNNLIALDGETATIDDVKVALGGNAKIAGWHSLSCDSCARSANAVVELGEDRDYESDTARICFDCAKAAAAAFLERANMPPPSIAGLGYTLNRTSR